MKLLITGGAGFIGSALIRYLIQHTDHTVLNVDKLTYAGNLESLTEVSNNPRYSFVQIDICDRAALDQVFTTHQPDAVMHLAAESHVDRSIDGPAAFIETNIVGTYTMLEAARAYWHTLPEPRKIAFRFHHISTDEVYGNLPHPNDEPVDCHVAPLLAETRCDTANEAPVIANETPVIASPRSVIASTSSVIASTPSVIASTPSVIVSTPSVIASAAKQSTEQTATATPRSDVLPLFTEETSYAPSSPYSASKASSDHLVRAWLRTYGFPTLITNCSNNYGPYQFPEKLIPLVILNALAGKSLPIYGVGDQIRDWLYVEDHVRALYTVLTQGAVGATYNIGGHNEKRNLEVVEAICEILDELVPRISVKTNDISHSAVGLKTDLQEQSPHARTVDLKIDPQEQSRPVQAGSYKELITYVADRPGHDRRYAIDASKIKNELGWTPAETFASGLRKTVQWYLDNQVWCQRVQDGSYQGQRLGITT